jgi:hypothetical protein
MNWQTVIRHYRMNHLPKHRAGIQWFVNQPTLAIAIEMAALARDSRGKRFGHQRRIPQVVLRAALQELRSRAPEIQACKSFNELHELIEDALNGVKGVGELYFYDTALRIAANLHLRPETVLLHAGTRVGARLITEVRGRRWLTRKDLPAELRRLPAEQVEDILCIYKDRIGGLHNRLPQRTARGRC